MRDSYWGVKGTVFSHKAWCTSFQVGSRDVCEPVWWLEG